MAFVSFRALAFCLALAASVAHASGKVAGDHPLIGPAQGFKSDRVEARDFGVFEIKPHEVNLADKAEYRGPTRFEGKVTRIRYEAMVKPSTTTVVALVQDHRQALEKLGARMLNMPGASQHVVSRWNVFELKSPSSNFNGYVLLGTKHANAYELVIVESAQQQYSVQAADLARELQASGMATLYIEFDTNRSELKPESQAVLAEVVKLLGQQPTLKLSVDGHTDNVGDAAANRRLSAARAQAVQAALVAQGVAAQRLASRGFGPEHPIADNRIEAGRAKNRRVELVRMP